MILVSEKLDLEVTSIALRMVSFIPEDVERELRQIVGNDYCSLTELDRMILVLAHQFGDINNVDVQHYRHEHPREIGECLKRLVKNGWLEQYGRGRGTHYALLNQSQQDLFPLLPNSEHYESNSEHYSYLQEIAAPVREKGRVDKELVEIVILKLCSEHYLQLRTLADLLGREPDSVRNHYVSPILNHPQQAYKATLLAVERVNNSSAPSPRTL